jgi:hypothetical protein
VIGDRLKIKTRWTECPECHGSRVYWDRSGTWGDEKWPCDTCDATGRTLTWDEDIDFITGDMDVEMPE